MNLRKAEKKRWRIFQLADEGLDSDFIAERMGMPIESVQGVLSGKRPKPLRCDACGCDPGWARSSIIDSLLLCGSCTTAYRNNPSLAHARWPSTFPPVNQ